MGVRGFMSQNMVLGDSNLANKFLEIKVDLEVTDSEATCLYHMINAQSKEAFEESEVIAIVPNQRDSVHTAMEKLLVVLNDVQKYVDNVVDGSAAPMAEYGMKIADAIGIDMNIYVYIYDGRIWHEYAVHTFMYMYTYECIL
jgi:translation initiation factor 3 subunit F